MFEQSKKFECKKPGYFLLIMVLHIKIFETLQISQTLEHDMIIQKRKCCLCGKLLLKLLAKNASLISSQID